MRMYKRPHNADSEGGDWKDVAVFLVLLFGVRFRFYVLTTITDTAWKKQHVTEYNLLDSAANTMQIPSY